MLSIVPAAAPFCVIDEVADGDAKPVSDGDAVGVDEVPREVGRASRRWSRPGW